MTELVPHFDGLPAVREAVEDVRDEIKRREIVISAAKKARLGTATINDAVGGKVRAMFRLADVVDQGQAGGWIAKAGGTHSPDSGEWTLPDLGIEAQRLLDARKLRAWYRDGNKTRLEEIVELATEQDRPLSYSGLLSSRNTASAIVASMENEWYTPIDYIEAARRVLGRIDLDPASSEAANETVQAAQIFTAAENGLDHPWHGQVWMNPPYGDWSGKFVAKLVSEHEAGNVGAAVALVNAHCTDTGWFQPLWNHTLCFTDHRIDFESAGREKTSTSTHGSVFAYLGSTPDTFADEFAKFGAVVARYA